MCFASEKFETVPRFLLGNITIMVLMVDTVLVFLPPVVNIADISGISADTNFKDCNKVSGGAV